MYHLILPALLALACFSAPAAARIAPSNAVTHVYDLSRNRAKPLLLLHTLGHGIWQYGDDRRLGRVERDVAFSAAFKYVNDRRTTGWHAQGYLAIRDLRQGSQSGAAGEAAPKPAEPQPDQEGAAFAAYLAGLPGLYVEAGYKITVPPSAPRFQRHLRAGRKRVKMHFADMGASWQARENLTENYHVNVFGFEVDDWLITLRVHFVGSDKTSAFLDGLSLTIKDRLPKGARHVRLTSVTPDNSETRVAFAVAKGMRRVNTAGPESVPSGQMLQFEQHDRRGRWLASLELERHYSRFDIARDLAAWKLRYGPLLGNSPQFSDREVAEVGMKLAVATANLDGRDVTICLLFFKLGTHRYTLRYERSNSAKASRALALREFDALLATLSAWETRAEQH